MTTQFHDIIGLFKYLTVIGRPQPRRKRVGGEETQPRGLLGVVVSYFDEPFRFHLLLKVLDRNPQPTLKLSPDEKSQSYRTAEYEIDFKNNSKMQDSFSVLTQREIP